MQAMIPRLKKFNLEIAPEKTKLFEFGKFTQLKAKPKGTKAATFNFLGFTQFCSRSQNGRGFRMKRKIISKRLSAKVKGYKEWLRSSRTLPTAGIMNITKAKQS